MLSTCSKFPHPPTQTQLTSETPVPTSFCAYLDKPRLVILAAKNEGLLLDHRSKAQLLKELGYVGECEQLFTLALGFRRKNGNDLRVGQPLM